jgi:acylphosphatase
MDGLSVIVKGRVQGVGFRYFTHNLANRLDLSGWVRNLRDGSVEVLAIGHKQVLERFLQELRAGPVGSRVDECLFQWLEGQTPLKNFTVN